MKKESLFLETIDITSLYRSDAFVTDVGAKLKIKQDFFASTARPQGSLFRLEDVSNSLDVV